jgi:uncharacterized membrane protein HdeD (DUF308 family)
MSTRASSSAAGTIGIIIVVIGVLAVIAGVVYLALPADKLPSFFPGHSAASTLHHSKRGIAGIVLGVVLLIVGAAVASRARRRAY